MGTKFKDLIPEIIIGQYRASPIFISFMQAMASEMDLLADEIENVKINRYLLVATGKQLDILGRIIGIDRVVVDFIDNIFFGFLEDATAQPFGDLSDILFGGRFVSVSENPVTSRKLDDNEYRALLLAKISKNSSNITPDEVLSITSAILSLMFVGGENISIKINEGTNASFEIEIGAALGGSDQAFIADLDIIPRPAGVRISYLYTSPPNTLLFENGLIMFTEDNLQLEIE